MRRGEQAVPTLISEALLLLPESQQQLLASPRLQTQGPSIYRCASLPVWLQRLRVPVGLDREGQVAPPQQGLTLRMGGLPSAPGTQCHSEHLTPWASRQPAWEGVFHSDATKSITSISLMFKEKRNSNL